MIDFKALSAPFDPREVLWRVGSTNKKAEERRTGDPKARATKGQALAYIDARIVMERLDAVCGPAGWQCKYSHANGKTVCDIAIWVGDDVANPNDLPVGWIWKANGAGDSDIEAEKGALSDAFKRAAVVWGIGRYLYDVDSPWVELDEWGKITTGGYKTLDMALRRHTQAILAGPQGPDWRDQAKNDIAQMQNAGDQKITEIKSAGRLAAELWGSEILGMFKQPGFTYATYQDWLREPCTPKGKKTFGEKLDEMRDKHPDLGEEIDKAAGNLPRMAA
jgi:hypothetical protein